MYLLKYHKNNSFLTLQSRHFTQSLMQSGGCGTSLSFFSDTAFYLFLVHIKVLIGYY